MRGREKPGNVLTTLVFTDIVASSQVAEELGDRRWRELLARHHRIVRDGLRDYGGRELDTAGDGVFARFDSPASAVNFAAASADALRELGIEIRVGIHIGECEIFEGKLSGVNVHAAARTMGQAGAGEILVTGSVRDLVRGAGFEFADRGVHELRGIEGDWRLFELTSIGDSHRSPPLPEGEARERRSQIEPPTLAKKRQVRVAAVAIAAAIVVAGAAYGLVHAVGGASAVPLTGCEVTLYPPLHDRSFNDAVYDGLTAASTRWGVGVHAKVSASESEWKRNVNDFVRQRCGLIVTFSTPVARDTLVAANTNLHQRFAIADGVLTAGAVRGTANLLHVQFKAEQSAFLAGYLAAGMTKTDKVATFGGTPLPTVTAYMDGFAAGVLHYNRVHGANVKLYGWYPEQESGLFLSKDTSDFAVYGGPDYARDQTTALISDGADVIFPVAGPGGEIGACEAAQKRQDVLLVGADTDQHYATPECVSQWLTSVLKVFRKMVYLAMQQVVEHRFRGGTLKGTLANGGVGLAPFYGLSSRVPLRLRHELGRVKQEIIKRSSSINARDYVD